MNTYKKIIATITLTILILSSTCMVFADNDATTLTDIKGHWAEQYINDVYNKGLMDAKEGTLFKPNDYITRYDVLISITRMMRADKVSDLTALVQKYQDIISKNNVPDSAKQAIAFSLEKKIIVAEDIAMFNSVSETSKVLASVFLGKAFEINTANYAANEVLKFDDGNVIPVTFQPYVEFLMSIGVINKASDANKSYKGYDFISRAVFAKMLSISNAEYEKNYLKLDDTQDNPGTTDDNTNDGTIDGTIDENTPTDTNDPGPVDDGNTNDDTNTPVQGDTIVEGFVNRVIPEYGNLALTVKQEDGTTKNEVYSMPDELSCKIDDVDSSYWKLKEGDIVNLYLKDGVVTGIIATSKIQRTTAIIKDIRIGDKVILDVQTVDKGERKSYAVTSTAKIIKDGKEVTYQDLKIGMKITIVTSYQELLELNTDVVKASDRGVIESISYSRTAPARIVIKHDDGEKVEYYTSKNLADENILIEGKESSIYDLRPNMMVDVTLENDEIIKIATVEHDTTVTVSGVVTSVNYDFGIIVLEYTNPVTNAKSTIKVFTTKAQIVDKTLKALTLQDIKVGSKLSSVFGTDFLGDVMAETIIVDK